MHFPIFRIKTISKQNLSLAFQNYEPDKFKTFYSEFKRQLKNNYSEAASEAFDVLERYYEAKELIVPIILTATIMIAFAILLLNESIKVTNKPILILGIGLLMTLLIYLVIKLYNKMKSR